MGSEDERVPLEVHTVARGYDLQQVFVDRRNFAQSRGWLVLDASTPQAAGRSVLLGLGLPPPPTRQHGTTTRSSRSSASEGMSNTGAWQNVGCSSTTDGQAWTTSAREQQLQAQLQKPGNNSMHEQERLLNQG